MGVDQSGVIVAHELTEATVDEATTAIPLIGAVPGDVARVTADTAYDTIAFYDAASARGAASAGQDRHGSPTQTAVRRA